MAGSGNGESSKVGHSGLKHIYDHLGGGVWCKKRRCFRPCRLGLWGQGQAIGRPGERHSPRETFRARRCITGVGKAGDRHVSTRACIGISKIQC